MQQYRGRFAPSPTGPLHIGSLLTALGSFLQAKNQHGKWLVRMEDLDPPREMPGAATGILNTLERFGLHWDEGVVYQSQRQEYYKYALQQLISQDLIYACHCSRKQIQETATTGKIGFVYPGYCQSNPCDLVRRHAKRLRTLNQEVSFTDLLQGDISHHLASDVGDIVVQRADGYFAYHLAVVVDDHHQQITEIVRGFDLIDCTPIQIYLQQKLEFTQPSYAHLPIIVNSNHEKLSKQTGAHSVENLPVEATLIQLLHMLKQQPPAELCYADKEEILQWARDNWSIKHDRNHHIMLTS